MTNTRADAFTCECEHAAHFTEGFDSFGATVKGIRHEYGSTFYAVTRVQTPYGAFTVCQECADDCLAPADNGR